MKKILLLILISFITLNHSAQTNTKKQASQIVWTQGVPTCPEDKKITELINIVGIDNLLKTKKNITKNEAKIYREIGVEFNKRGLYDASDWYLERVKGYIEVVELEPEIVFENPKDFSELVNNRGLANLSGTPRSPQSVLSHLYSVTEVMKLPYSTNSEYDIIIKARFDLGRINRDTSGPGKSNPYPVQCINFQTEIQSDKIYMADWNHFHMGPADMWFYGSMNTMKPFTTLYNSLEEQMEFRSPFHTFATQIEGNPGDLSNSIAFYKWWMIQNGLWQNRINLETIWE